MNLPTLTKPELPDTPLGLLTTPGSKPVLAGAAVAVKTAPPARKDDTLTALVEALGKVEDFCSQARNLANQSQNQQGEYRRRAEQAEADKTHLEQENVRLRAQLEALEQRVPRWVRRIFGATTTA